MKNYLKFIGTGGAFSSINTNNSAYYIKDNHMILFDCGETVFHEIIKKDIINDKIKKLDIIITHFHSDHVGSLGSLVFFCRFKKIKDVNIIFPTKDIPRKLLDIFGISDKLYNIKTPSSISDYYLKEYEQVHGDVDKDGNIIPMPAYGYHLKYGNDSFFYSGDTCTINEEVLDKFKKGEIEILYHEVTTDGYKAHVQLEDLEKAIPKECRDRVYCMHMGDAVDIEEIKKIEFRSVR